MCTMKIINAKKGTWLSFKKQDPISKTKCWKLVELLEKGGDMLIRL